MSAARPGWLEQSIKLSKVIRAHWLVGVYLISESNQQVGIGDLINSIGNDIYLELVGVGDGKMPPVICSNLHQPILK